MGSEWFCRWFMTHGITGVLDYAHRPILKNSKEHKVSETVSVSVLTSSGEDRNTKERNF
jgi:hypothetical protein